MVPPHMEYLRGESPPAVRSAAKKPVQHQGLLGCVPMRGRLLFQQGEDIVARELGASHGLPADDALG